MQSKGCFGRELEVNKEGSLKKVRRKSKTSTKAIGLIFCNNFLLNLEEIQRKIFRVQILLLKGKIVNKCPIVNHFYVNPYRKTL